MKRNFSKVCIESMIFLLFFLFSCHQTIFAGNFYWATHESFGLGVESINGRNPITWFVPRSSPIFVENRMQMYQISGQKFLKAQTLAGVWIYVLETTVSEHRIESRYPSGNLIIFHNRVNMCDKKFDCSENEKNNIHAGYICSYEIDYNFFKITCNGNPSTFTGYIEKELIEDFGNTGKITIFDPLLIKRPKYERLIEESFALGTKCGQIRNIADKVDMSLEAGFGIEFFGLFTLGAKGESGHEYELTSSIGDKGVSVRFVNIKLKEKNGKENLEYFVRIDSRCRGGNILSNESYIESIVIKNKDLGTTESFDFDSLNSSKKLMELRYLRHPYFFSINNSKQYFNLLSWQSDVLENRYAREQIFSYFNRTCYSKYRKRDACADHSYEN